ncbi:alpha/beta hydrolase [Paenibacillus gansuensis]|uniref:Alpha/beta hydrolase n=1 Tax=Paenibacillus gansuensis TaxID=306542 RepID=A0ABW5PIF6_9BACL
MNVVLWPEGAPLAKGDQPADQPSMTAYLVESDAPAAAVVVCPGGGYWLKAYHEGEPVAQWLNSIGISAFVLHYRTAEDGYHHPCPLMDVQRAMRLVRSKAQDWNVDPHRVGVLGFSAGGHLAASAGTLPDIRYTGRPAADDTDRLDARPDLMVLCYPVISFGPHGHHGSRDNLLAGHTDAAELAELFSLENRVNGHTPPAFLWHTADDEGVPVQNSLMFAEALSRHNVPFDLHVYRHGRHGLGLAEEDAHVGTWTAVCAEWLKANGF